MAIVCLCALLFANAEPRGRISISHEVIANAVRLAGTEVTPEQVHVLSNVTARAGAILRVKSVAGAADGKLLAKMACRNANDCLPFYVLVDEPRNVSNGANKAHSAPTLAKAQEHPLVARGQPVTLVIDKTDSRIRLSVICLEGGLAGQTIRVASPDRKRIYTAEVINSTVVRSAL
ncbi:MAG: flagella basal body P-ring formation protein FlgA [Terriglobales bacterium]